MAVCRYLFKSSRLLFCLLCGVVLYMLSYTRHSPTGSKHTEPVPCMNIEDSGTVDHLDHYAEKFSPDSRHILSYGLRQDDVLTNLRFTESNTFAKRYIEDWQRTWSVVLNVFNAYVTDPSGITLATHMSPARLNAFRLLVDRWQGPMSVSVYVARSELQEFFKEILSIISNRSNIFIHVILKGEEFYYPSNLLRNIAARSIQTEYAFLNDVDFLPSDDAEENLYRHAKTLHASEVYVLPAFAFLEKHEASDLSALTSKDVLLRETTHNGTIVKFYKYSGYGPGHRCTEYDKWANATDIYTIKYEMQFEPYVLMYTADVVHYPETFLGRYYDKASLFVMLAVNRYRYRVVPDAWVIHYYHPILPRDKRILDWSTEVYVAWKRHLNKLYGVDFSKWRYGR